MKWEYRFERITADYDEATKELNQFGEDGWELVNLEWFRDIGDIRGQPMASAGNAQYGTALLKRHKFDWGVFRAECCGPRGLEVMSDEEREKVGPAKVGSGGGK